MREATGGKEGRRLARRGSHREVPRCDDSNRAFAGRRIDVGEIGRRQTRASDDDAYSRADRRHRVLPHGSGRGVVDEDVDAVERLGDGRVYGKAKRLTAERFPEIATRGRSADGRDEVEVGRVEHGGHERAACPARRARNAHAQLPSSLHGLCLDQLDPVSVREAPARKPIRALIRAR
jgi:hypothetical protein